MGKLRLLDESVDVDGGILSQLTGPAAAKRFLDEIVSVLPSASRPVTAEQAVQRLATLKASDMHRLAPPAAQRLLEHVSTQVGLICEEGRVGMGSLSSDPSLGTHKMLLNNTDKSEQLFI